MTLHASPGDRIVIKGHNVGSPDRDGKILEANGPDGTPPFIVEWADNGHVTTFFPGIDAEVHHHGHTEVQR